MIAIKYEDEQALIFWDVWYEYLSHSLSHSVVWLREDYMMGW